MKKVLTLAAVAAIALPTAAAAQLPNVDRQSYTFIDNRLDLVVAAEAPGVLQVVRGERGRVEVASRNTNGLAGAGLGGTFTRQLTLSAAGSGDVEYLVVVPEHVSVHVRLPEGGRASLSPSSAAGTYRWGAASPGDEGAAAEAAAPAATPLASGMVLLHSSVWAPGAVDIADLHAVRSLSVRVEGGEFRVAASRPLAVQADGGAELLVRPGTGPVDIVLYVPAQGPQFVVQSGGVRIAEVAGGQARALCGSVVVQRPSEQQTWLTFRPQAGQLDCR